jgi:DNA-binding transcriptional LysR family regulator
MSCFSGGGRGWNRQTTLNHWSCPLREMLDGLELMFEKPRIFDPLTASASFKISGSDFFAEMLMPRLAELVSSQAPGVRVQLVDLVPDSHIDTIERYEVDIALIPAIALPDWAEQRPVFRSTFFCHRAPGQSPASARRPQSGRHRADRSVSAISATCCFLRRAISRAWAMRRWRGSAVNAGSP